MCSIGTTERWRVLSFFFSSRRRHTRCSRDWSSDVCSSDLWRDNDPEREPVVEIYQGDRQNYEIPDGPRANSEKDSIGGWRPKGFVSLALAKEIGRASCRERV